MSAKIVVLDDELENLDIKEMIPEDEEYKSKSYLDSLALEKIIELEKLIFYRSISDAGKLTKLNSEKYAPARSY